jgi:dienelactone hydrolase
MAMTATNDFLQRLLEENRPAFAYTADTDWKIWRSGLKERLARRLGLHPVQAYSRTTPDEPVYAGASFAPDEPPVVLERVQCQGYVRERVEWTTMDGMRMPVYVLIPDGVTEPRPGVVAIHGHGYGSREIVGLEPDGAERGAEPGLHKDFAVALVKQGFVVAAPELLAFGDRRLPEDIAAGPKQSSCARISAQLMLLGRNIGGVRVAETMQTVGYLLSRPDVKPGAIGCMGISGGGLVAAYTAALDERIGATVVSGYANTFQGSILSRMHCLDNYIPGILQDAEMPELIGLIAPRSLLVESGDTDRVFPREGAMKAMEKLAMIYEAAGAEEELAVDYFTGGHEISGAKAYQWLRRLE